MRGRDFFGAVTIAAVWGVAAVITRFTPLSLPTGVVGLLLLAAGLFSGIIRLSLIETTADFLLKHMILFFIPAVVGVIAYTEQLRQCWFLVTAAILIPYALVLLSVGFVAARVPAKQQKEKESTSPQ